MRKAHWILIVGLAVGFGCGGKKNNKASGDDSKSTAKARGTDGNGSQTGAAPNLEAKPLGFEKLRYLGYRFSRGSRAYHRAERALRKAKKHPDKADELWKAIEKHCAAAVAANPRHLDAHFLLAVARARAGAKTGLADHLSTALAADWLKFGPMLKTEKHLQAYLAGPEGKALAALATRYEQEFTRKAAAGILLVGRRSAFRPPSKPGDQWSTTRAELFSYDLQTDRYLRLTHTKESVAAFLLSPSGDEIAYVGYNRVIWPKDDQTPPLLKHSFIGILSTETFQLKGKPIHLHKQRHGLGLQYRAGDELVVASLETMGRYKPGAPRWYVVDRGESKLRKLKTKPTTPNQLVVTYDWVSRLHKPAPHIQAERESSTFRLLRTKQTITLPAGEMVSKDAFVWSPDGAHLAFHTIARPCEEKPQSGLYLVEAATGKLKSLLRGRSRFGTKWIDNERLVYEDPDGNLRIYNASELKHERTLKNRAGLSLSGLAAKKQPFCREDNIAKPSPPPVKAPAPAPGKPAGTSP